MNKIDEPIYLEVYFEGDDDIEQSFAEFIGDQQCSNTDQGRKQPGGKFGDSESLKRRNLAPVHQGWLMGEQVPIVIGSDPVTAVQHFDGRFGEDRLVHIPQPRSAEVRHEYEQSNGHQRDVVPPALMLQHQRRGRRNLGRANIHA